MASRNGKLETVRTLVELGVEKEAKDEVRNLMMMMIVIMTSNIYDDNGDDDNDDDMKYV